MKCIDQKITERFAAYQGDCVEVLTGVPDESIDYIIFSPPFSSLYTYSSSDRDMGNCRNDAEFFEHYRFLSKELFRILKPGRNMSIHCMDLPTTKSRDGYIGLRDFPGDLIRLHQSDGFILQSRATIWKDPVVAMQRTKALGLLWKQIKKDSSMCRQGIPDYLITFRKPGENQKPISHTAEEFPVREWQELASPCWMDIKQSDTLNRKLARDNEDERHIAPLQLGVIRKALRLWSGEGDVVCSPFMGIGSEGYEALLSGRNFIGVELKGSYFRLGCKYLEEAETSPGTQTTMRFQ